MNPTKIVYTICASALAVWLFCTGLVFGTKKARTDIEKEKSTPSYTAVYQTVLYTQPTAAAPSETSPTEAQPTAAASEPVSEKKKEKENKKKEEQTSAAPSETTDAAEVCELYTKAVNLTKSMKDFSLTREDTLNLFIDDVTGGSIVKSFANSFASAQVPHSVEELVFKNGVDTKGSGETPLTCLPPITDYAAIDSNCLISASATPNEYGGYNISLALPDEVQTLTSPALNHSTTMEVIDVASLGLPSMINITQLNIYYSGATINAVTDADGKLLNMTHYLPVSHADGSGKAVGVTANMTLHGDFTCIYTVTY